jgi:peptide-methionine (S)-S-oxide reductase
MIRILSAVAVAAALAFTAAPARADIETETAVFAGGCFWCVEADFDKVKGVLSTVSGYTGGDAKNPTYEDVTYGDTGHYEAVEITYNPDLVDYRTLVDYFFRTVDPTDAGGQFCDRGDSYRTAVFALDAEQRAAAEAAKAEAASILKEEVVTPILDASTFWKAEEYHQNYYKKKPVRYRYYRWNCGRDQRLEDLWGEAAGQS